MLNHPAPAAFVLSCLVLPLVVGCGEKPKLTGGPESVASQLGEADLKSKDWDGALRHFGEGVRLNPSNPALYLGRGRAWAGKGEFDKAAKDFDEAIRLDPTQARAFYYRGITSQTSGEFERAVEDYTEAVRLDPEYAAAFINRASVWGHVGEWDKAVDDYTEGLKHDPRVTIAYAQRSVMWQYKKEWRKALDDLDEAVRLDPDSLAANSGRAWLLATCPDPKYRDGKKAVEQARRACDLAGWAGGDTLNGLAAAYAEDGQFGEAVRWQKKALEDAEFVRRSGETGKAALRLYEGKKPYRQ